MQTSVRDMAVKCLLLLSLTSAFITSSVESQEKLHRPQGPAVTERRSELAQAAQGSSATVERGYQLLDAGDARGAERTFLVVLAAEPENADAQAGLAWAYAAQGDVERAAEAADERLALIPDDPSWRIHWLSIISEAPSRRDEAIEGYRALIAENPTDQSLLLRLADLLSWTVGRGAEAVDAYRAAVSNDPTDRAARLGLAQVLSWEGELFEAAKLFDALIADQADVEALYGRAQVARWEADFTTAHRCLQEALAMAPDDPRLQDELVVLERDEMLIGTTTQTAVVETDADAAGTEAESTRDTRPLISAKYTHSGESEGFVRIDTALRGELYLWQGNRIRLEPRWTMFRDDSSINRLTLGLELRQNLPYGLYGSFYYLPHLFSEQPTVHDLGGEMGVTPLELPLDIRIGRRRRSLVDAPPLSYEDVAFLYSIGAQGQTIEAIREGLQVREWYFGLSSSPLEGLYVYLDVMFGEVDDGNQRTSVSAGAGLDILEIAGVAPKFDLFVQYDDFYLSYSEEQPLYYSPSRVHVGTPALEFRWRPIETFLVGARGGWSFVSEGSGGPLMGGFFRWAFAGRAYLEGRVQFYESPQYRVGGGTIGMGVRL